MFHYFLCFKECKTMLHNSQLTMKVKIGKKIKCFQYFQKFNQHFKTFRFKNVTSKSPVSATTRVPLAFNRSKEDMAVFLLSDIFKFWNIVEINLRHHSRGIAQTTLHVVEQVQKWCTTHWRYSTRQ